MRCADCINYQVGNDWVGCHNLGNIDKLSKTVFGDGSKSGLKSQVLFPLCDMISFVTVRH